MKKTIIILTLILTFVVSIITAHASFGIKLYIDGNHIETEIAPMIVNDRTLVPARVVFEYLDAEVEWIGKTRQVAITTDDVDMLLKIGSTTAIVNNKKVELDCAPMIVSDRTMIPIRFVSESMGCKVEWDGVTKKVLITTPGSDKQVEVISLSTKKTKTSTNVQIALSNDASPSVTVLPDPYRIIVDFENAKLFSPNGKENPHDGYVDEIRWAQHDTFSRIVIQCPVEQPYKITGDGTTAIVIKVGDKNSQYLPEPEPDFEPLPPEDKPLEPDSPDDGTQGGDSEVDTEITTPENEQILTNIVVIDAGHGGSDPGSLGRDSYGNVIYDENGEPLIKEKDINLYIAQKARDYLEANGVKVIMTRDDDTFEGTNEENLMARANLANSVNASLFLSVHNNSFTSPAAHGTEICYTPYSEGFFGITSMDFANNVISPLVEATGLYNRGLSSRPNLAVLKFTKMPAILLECGFVTNSTDLAVLTDKNKLDKMGKAICDGIINTLKVMNENKQSYATETESIIQ